MDAHLQQVINDIAQEQFADKNTMQVLWRAESDGLIDLLVVLRDAATTVWAGLPLARSGLLFRPRATTIADLSTALLRFEGNDYAAINRPPGR
jgi:hypothetical protein